MPESDTTRELSPREQKYRRIQRAAIEVFASKGYFGARMTDVAAAAKWRTAPCICISTARNIC